VKRALLLVIGIVSAFTPAAAGPALPDIQGPDVPALSEPAVVVTAFRNAEFSCAQQATRTTTIAVPAIDYNRVVLVVKITPDGDPWDRLFGVAIGGVEVLRGTTPRTKFTLRKDITEFAALLPPGGTADVSLMSGSYVGRLLESVKLEFYAHEPTARLVRAPAPGVVAGFLWESLSGDATMASSTAAFPTARPSAAIVELTISGHGESGEFWYLDDPIPRAFHVSVDGKEIAIARSISYTYALIGFGNANANNACAGPGTSAEGDLLHPLMWWTAQRLADLAGIHAGVGEIPPYRATVAAGDLALLTGGRSVEVRQQGGDALPQSWPVSLAFLLG
jgi:hypothetical protein